MLQWSLYAVAPANVLMVLASQEEKSYIEIFANPYFTPMSTSTPLFLWGILSLLVLAALPLPGQELLLVRDSIHCERGISGTQEFLPESRILFPRYDAQGQLLEEITEERQPGGQWQARQRRLFSYTGDQLSERRMQRWNPNTQQWAEQRRDHYSYHAGLLQEYLRQQSSPSGTLTDERRWRYAYNEAGRQTIMLVQDWNGSDWLNLSRKLTSYTPEGNLERQTLEVWKDGDWLPTRSRLWTYAPVEGALRVSATTVQRWSAAESRWMDVSRKLFAYDENGLWVASRFEDWSPSTAEWVNTDRMLYQYDAQRVPTGQVLQKWEGDWLNHGRVSYDLAANSFLSRIDNWDVGASQWQNFLRYRIETYDDNRLRQKTGMQAWNPTSNEWENRNYTQRYTHFWAPLVVSSPEAVAVLTACTVPNPYPAGTPFSCNLPTTAQPYQLEIHDLLGRRVYNQLTSSPQDLRIDFRGPSGLYLLRVRRGQKVYHLQRLFLQ